MSTGNQTDNWAADVEAQYQNDAAFGGGGFDPFDTEGVEPDAESRPVDKEGWYHFEFQDVKAYPETCKDGNPALPQTPHLLFICRVLHTAKGQSPEGSVYFHRFYTGSKGGGRPADGTIRNNVNFLCGIGILKKEKRQINGEEKTVAIDTETGTTRVNVESLPQRIKGRQFIGHIKCTKSDDPQYPDKYELQFGRGAYQVDDPAVADIPKNVEMLAAIGMAGNSGQGAGRRDEQGQVQQPQQAQQIPQQQQQTQQPQQPSQPQSPQQPQTAPAQSEVDLDI